MHHSHENTLGSRFGEVADLKMNGCCFWHFNIRHSCTHDCEVLLARKRTSVHLSISQEDSANQLHDIRTTTAQGWEESSIELQSG